MKKQPMVERSLNIADKGSVTIIMGARWGDEGKGKLAHRFGLEASIGTRYGGGGNSGHTVYPFTGVDIKVALNHMPGCAVSKNGVPVLARGMVIDPRALIEKEISKLRELGFLQDPCLPLIDHLAHVVMPWHFKMDDPTGKIGSTKKGIGPAYTDKVARRGIRINDLLHAGTLQTKAQEALEFHNVYFRHLGLPEMDANQITDEYLAIGEIVRPHILDAGEYLLNALESGHNIIGEGHQGIEIGVESIEYPYVTSSDTSSGAFCVGTGVPMGFVKQTIGIIKAYDTSVGVRPGFLAKQDNSIGEKLRQCGGEFGATTGRPRDCGWLDVASLAQAIRRNGITGIAMNKLDVLTGFPTICLCVGYEDADGKQYDTLPIDFDERSKLKPRYLELPGWNKDIRGIQKLNKLPKNARHFVFHVQRLIGAPIIGVGTGPHPEDMIWIE